MIVNELRHSSIVIPARDGESCMPILPPYFDVTVELPVKAIVRAVFLVGDPDHVAKSPQRGCEAEDSRDGEPVLFRPGLRLARKVVQQW
jgi:hypothetical protein